jgi:hypothetical protein
VGLIQRQIEDAGISTISLTSFKELTEFQSVPRSVYYRFPRGGAIGKPGDVDMQHGVLMETLSAAQTIELPGTIVKGSYRWSGGEKQ